MTVADTDVLIDFLAGQPPGAEQVAQELERGHLATTAITRFELLAGARTAPQRSASRRLLERLPCLALDHNASDRAAEVRWSLAPRGQDIGTADTLIAGTVLTHRGVLLTRNRRHFDRVPGLSIART